MRWARHSGLTFPDFCAGRNVPEATMLRFKQVRGFGFIEISRVVP
jgi:hypothetical protein